MHPDYGKRGNTSLNKASVTVINKPAENQKTDAKPKPNQAKQKEKH